MNRQNILYFSRLVLIVPTCLYLLCLLNLASNIAREEPEMMTPRINACIIVLVRNKDFSNLVKLVQQVEAVFNKKYNYPYVIFNDEEFTSTFKTVTQQFTRSFVDFAVIDKEMWSVPEWIDSKRLAQSMYTIGFGVGYRHMCRFYSGFFFRHNSTLKYDYFMRLDTDSVILDLVNLNDPFRIFSRTDKKVKYAFLLANSEFLNTMPTLWTQIKSWAKNSSLLPPKGKQNGLSFLSHDQGETLNTDLCIFYNNFEMGDFGVFREKSYLDYFDYLDKSGGFFYERWV